MVGCIIKFDLHPTIRIFSDGTFSGLSAVMSVFYFRTQSRAGTRIRTGRAEFRIPTLDKRFVSSPSRPDGL
jgi:hypothetical protein